MLNTKIQIYMFEIKSICGKLIFVAQFDECGTFKLKLLN